MRFINSSVSLCTLGLLCFSAAPRVQAADPNTPQPERFDSGLLERAAAANRDLYGALQSFVCRELIERFKGSTVAPAGKHIDTITAQVSLENGNEHYSEIYQKNRRLQDLAALSGAWSEGEFGTLLLQTEQLLATQKVFFEAKTEVGGVPAVACRFDVSAADSPWKLTVSGQEYVVPFQTEVWLAADSGRILKIARSAVNLPASLYISRIDWSVTLGPFELNGRTWLLPSSGGYQVVYRDSDRREWNTMQFSGYQRYGSVATIRFE